MSKFAALIKLVTRIPPLGKGKNLFQLYKPRMGDQERFDMGSCILTTIDRDTCCICGPSHLWIFYLPTMLLLQQPTLTGSLPLVLGAILFDCLPLLRIDQSIILSLGTPRQNSSNIAMGFLFISNHRYRPIFHPCLTRKLTL